MKTTCPVILSLVTASFALALDAPYPFKPVNEVTLSSDNFWHPRLETNHEVTVWHDFEECEKSGRLDNFRKAAGEKEGYYQGLRFDDSDVHKVLEGAARILGQSDDPRLDAHIDELIATMAKAQDQDGYLYTVMQVPHDPKHPVKGVVVGERWKHEQESHETYSIGHLIEAAAVHFEQTGKRNYLNIAVKAADCIDRNFGPGKLELPPGHQEVEIGLVKLAQVTGEKRYVDLAHWFLEQRGRISNDRKRTWGAYFQDHKPVIGQDEAVGHAVRAAYQYMAMADVAVIKDIELYRDALHKVWENVASKKLYLTGGIGGGSGEGFSGEYQLPNLGAYNETCSSIANILWNQRMFQLEGDAKYIEVLERCLYNSFLSGISMEGDTFFYPNKLTSANGNNRSPWFRCACCPPNVVRLIPQIPSLSYATHTDTLHVNLYGSNQAKLRITGQDVEISQHSAYPWEGSVKLTVNPAKPSRFTLALRIPGWLKEPFPSDLYRYSDHKKNAATITVNGGPPTFTMSKGYARIDREWKPRDTVSLEFPMPVRRVLAHPEVDACQNRVALMRGPIVYAAEGPDNNRQVHNLLVPGNASFTTTHRPSLLGGLITVTGEISALSWNDGSTGTIAKPHKLTAIPYYAWAHRGPSPMRVWLASSPGAAWPTTTDTAYTKAKITTSGHNRWTTPSAIQDEFLPQSSNDLETPRFLWDDAPGAPVGAGALETEDTDAKVKSGIRWIQYEFKQAVELSSSSIYWVQSGSEDHRSDRLPSSFRIVYKNNGKWKPVDSAQVPPVPDQFQAISFPKITTDAIRLEVTPVKKQSVGLFEWAVR